jgi:diadenosine tetraphosphate (Ap4A) HIT family hydrolase
VAFSDYRPASKHHFLIIPKQHMEGIRHLKEDDIPVIRELETIGKKVQILVEISRIQLSMVVLDYRQLDPITRPGFR